MENNVDTGRDTRISNLAVTIKDPSQLESSLQQMRNILSLTHRGIRDFGFETKEDWLDNIETSTRAAKLSGGLIAGISLLVGGLGIANIMLASISERIREIGIRRAVGATAFDIFIQIVIEATSLAILGGILGVAAGFALVQVLVMLAPAQNNPIIEPTAILISLGFAFLVGVLAGLYPAFKAAQLSPIQALRYE
jgi:putative ABC transport system permease protein